MKVSSSHLGVGFTITLLGCMELTITQGEPYSPPTAFYNPASTPGNYYPGASFEAAFFGQYAERSQSVQEPALGAAKVTDHANWSWHDESDKDGCLVRGPSAEAEARL